MIESLNRGEKILEKARKFAGRECVVTIGKLIELSLCVLGLGVTGTLIVQIWIGK